MTMLIISVYVVMSYLVVPASSSPAFLSVANAGQGVNERSHLARKSIAPLPTAPLRSPKRVWREDRRRETVRCFFNFGGSASKQGPPANYDAIASQAIAAVQAGLKAREKAMEVEFPPLASLNKVNDGSAKGRGQAQASTLSFAKKLINAVARSRRVYVACCEPGAKAILEKGIKADVRDLNSKDLPPAKEGDVQVVITPADQGQWKLARKMSETAPVVIVNGVFVNGYVPFEPVYYFKPISGFSTVVGSVVRQYPGPFTAYLAGSNKVVPCEAGLIKQGDVRRPDLRSAANALMAAYQEQQQASRR